MKIAYFGYDFFYRCLETLVEDQHEIVRIFSYDTDNKYNFNDNIERIANNLNIGVQINKVAKEDIVELYKKKCDLIIVAAYPYNVPVLEDYPIRGINIHPTLLPEGRGVWPLPHIILNEFKKSGVTIHKLTKHMDSGDILLQEEFLISEREDLETLSCKSQLLAMKLLRNLMDNFDVYWGNATSQVEGTCWPMPSDHEMTLDWNLTVKELDKIVRAFGKFDSCAQFDDRMWVVQDINGWEEKHSFKPGQVVHRTNKEVLIAVKNGFVCLRFFEEDTE